jgi:dTDP-4-dehydrorhamnose 3,5-epimerase
MIMKKSLFGFFLKHYLCKNPNSFMTFKFNKLEIPGVMTIEPKSFSDDRGFFFENFKESEFIQNGIEKKFVQDNFSHSTQGVLRGLHYQKNPHAQAKLLSVLKGKIFDVAVDIRVNSPTFGKWVSVIISEEDHKLIYIPEGFAHGFCVLSNEADVLYKVTNEYSPKDERGIKWNDPDINIAWPIDKPLLHEKDSRLPFLKNIDNDF